MLTLNTIRLTSFVISNALSLFLISSHTTHTFSDSALMSVFFGLLYLYIRRTQYYQCLDVKKPSCDAWFGHKNIASLLGFYSLLNYIQ